MAQPTGVKRHFLARLEDKVQIFAEWAEGSRWFIPAFISILYLPTAVVIASTKPFWNDELFTWYIARLHGFSDIWAVLLTGAEQIPPLFFALTRLLCNGYCLSI